MFRSTVRRAEQRAAYIDWARGLAVVLMIEAHTLDAWTRPASRGSYAFRYATLAAGFAAPLFLWLAGLAVPLAAAATLRKGASRQAAAERVVKRGLEVFILAFLFRLQAFVITPGAHPLTLFRVDILNIMGPAIVACGLIWVCVESTSLLVIAYSIVAAAVAMLAPLVRTLRLVSVLPIWVQWYVRPAGENTTFTGIPWVGFVFAGAAVGTLLAHVRGRDGERRLFAAVASIGALLVGFGLFAATLPSIYSESSFWTTSPTYFAIRAGVMMTALAVFFGVSRFASLGALGAVLGRFGRSSLFVYWIHVELVYGYASWLLRRRLPIWGTATAFLAFTALMFGAVVLRDHLVNGWRRREQITFQYKVNAV